MIRPLAFAALAALATTSIACSSSTSGEEGQTVDTGSALTTLRSPTGSFSAATAGKAFGGYRTQKADSQRVSAPTSGGSVGTRSIRLLDRASGSCGQGQACACPNGGSMTYAAESNADGQMVKVRFASCSFEDGFGFDGNALLLVSNKSLLGYASEAASAPKAPSTGSGGTGSSTGTTGTGAGSEDSADGYDSSEGLSESGSTSGAAAVLLAAKGTASYGAKKLPLEIALLTEGKYAFLAVSVPDGKIVIGVSADGRAIVKSKEGTWNCQSSAGGWVCKSDSGESLNVKEEAATEEGSSSSDDAPSAPSAPSAPPAPSADF